MRDDYKAWIAEHYPTQVSAFGACKDASAAMVIAFPELRQVHGTYDDPRWGDCDHWWCVTEDGSIVDPTAKQFPSRGFGNYQDPDAKSPSGSCPECGAYTYGGQAFCCPEHEESHMAYLDPGIL